MRRLFSTLALISVFCTCSLAFAVTVNVTTPANGASVTPPIPIAASASSYNRITGWRIYVDGRSVFQAGATSGIATALTTSAGTHQVVVRAWDSTGRYGSATLTVNVQPPPVAVSIAPSAVTLSTAGSQQFTATVSGTTNTGVAWLVNGVVGGSATNGIISATGLYTAPQSVGNAAVTVSARSVANTSKMATATVTLTTPTPTSTTNPPGLTAPLRVLTNLMPTGFVNQPYSESLNANGGKPSYTWSVSSGALPPGITLTSAGVSGTPVTAGNYNFTIRVTDAEGQSANAALSMPVVNRGLYNVLEYGVTGAAQHVHDGAMLAGSHQLTSPTAQFTSGDAGQPIYVLGVADNGAPLSTTISSVTNATTVVLAAAATTSASGVSVTWGRDDMTAIRGLLSLVGSGGGGIVYFPGLAGNHVYQVSGLGAALTVANSNTRLEGDGPSSLVFNSYVQFRSATCGGTTYYDQTGNPVLYVNAGGAGEPSIVSNVEIDHMAFEDNGQNFRYGSPTQQCFGAGGPGVLGLQTPGLDGSTQINNVSLHDLTIKTDYLVGINLDAYADKSVLYNNTIQEPANHPLYLAGYKTHLWVYNNTLSGTADGPARIGLAVKGGDQLNVINNDVSNVSFEGISVSGDSSTQINTNVLIAGNRIHDCTDPGHTVGIDIVNANGVLIEGNALSNILWDGIDIRTPNQPISNVIVRNNTLDRITVDGAINAWAAAQPLTNITITGNIVTNSVYGVYLSGAGGTNLVAGNSVTGDNARPPDAYSCGTGYWITPLSSSTTTVTGNTGLYCAQYNWGNLTNQATVYTDNSVH